MKRFVALTLILCVALVSEACAIQFSAEGTAKSVMKLYAYSKASDTIYSGTGSGFVAFNSSTLITNYHVIDGMTYVVASDDEDNSYILDKVLCADKEADIAILGFSEPTNLKPLDLFPSDKLERGSEVVAIGSPKGLKNTVSSGIISLVYTKNGIPWIQMTAPISPGSSGGALLNEFGDVIGVTTATYNSRDFFGNETNAQNINYAVNVAVAQAMYNAWDGNTYSLKNHKSSAKMDYSGVYNQSSLGNEEEGSGKSQGSESWTCSECGAENTGLFCQECGAEKKQWTCVCGKINTKKFCGNCGNGIEGLTNQINEALGLIEQNRYDEAIEELKVLGSFDSGSFETAKGKHVTADNCLCMAYYEKGLFLLHNGEFDECREAFLNANNYKDSQVRILEAYYREGLAEAEKGNYQTAMDLLAKAGEFDGAADKISEINELTGRKHLLEILSKGSTSYSEEERDRQFDPSVLIWDKDRIHFDVKSVNAISLIEKNLFYKVGEGYLDYGFDPFVKTQGNDLIYEFDKTWMSINLNIVIYQRMNFMENGDSWRERGYVPALVNGEKTNLILEFNDKVPDGFILGAVDTIEKPYKQEFDEGELKEVAIGDRIQYVCDCISDRGTDMYFIGDADVMQESMLIGYAYIYQPENAILLYRITDKEGNVYWSPVHK